MTGALSDWIVVIPSYNRVDTLKEKTLKLLQEYKIPASKIYLFVANEEQKTLYEAGLEKGSVGHIIVGVKGLAEVRNFIFKYFPKGKRLVCMDDDIRGLIEYDSSVKRHERRLVSLSGVFNRGFEECKKAGANLWGIYPTANPFYMTDKVTSNLKYIIGAFFGIRNTKDPVYRLKYSDTQEDKERTIRYWQKDGVVVRLNYIAPKTTYFAPGGLEAMTALAFALRIDPVMVGVHHIARFTLIGIGLPLALKICPSLIRGSSP